MPETARKKIIHEIAWLIQHNRDKQTNRGSELFYEELLLYQN
jgi:hypothetical protein